MEMGKDVSGAAKQALRRLRQRLRREPDTRAVMEQLEADPNDSVVQEQLAEQLTGKLKDPAFRERLQSLLEELDREVASAIAAEERLQAAVGERQAGMPADPGAAVASTGTRPVRDELVAYLGLPRTISHLSTTVNRLSARSEGSFISGGQNDRDKQRERSHQG